MLFSIYVIFGKQEDDDFVQEDIPNRRTRVANVGHQCRNDKQAKQFWLQKE